MKKLILRGEKEVNCYFIENKSDCYIIDPGFEKERIISYAQKTKLNVVGILLTHAHVDHMGAIDCFQVPIYLHEKEYDIFIENQKNGFDIFSKTPDYPIEKLDIQLIEDKDQIELNDLSIEIIHTPGHTQGSVCYKADNVIFTGDTIVKGTVGIWSLPTGNLEQLMSSVIKILDNYDQTTALYPGHGLSTTIYEEKRTNNYYQKWKTDPRIACNI